MGRPFDWGIRFRITFDTPLSKTRKIRYPNQTEWGSAEHREKVSRRFKGRKFSKSTLIKMSCSQRERFTNSKAREQISDSLKEMYKINPSRKIELSDAGKKRWRDNEYAKNIFSKQHKRPNTQELYLDAFLQLNFPKQWKYVGDGKIWIEGKNPDFININGKKIVIEYNGFKLTHTPEKDKDKTEHYAHFGFDTINLYEKDLKNEAELINTIRRTGYEQYRSPQSHTL